MSIDELKYKEAVLRECFKDKLEKLNVEGTNDCEMIKHIKTFGALWYYTYQLLMAEERAAGTDIQSTTAETMDIQATGLKMARSK